MSPQVCDLLSAAGANFKVHAHAALISYEEARQALPFDVAAMVKALAFRLKAVEFSENSVAPVA
jgi:Cys-tRNA(Pro)/Cys-tRNA(Cys) deacylase